jgi:methionyl-tRNA synthetase
VPANEFLNLEGNKFSTSKNWAIWLDEFLIDFPDMQDALRYTLTVNAPETKDNDFTWKDFQARNNNELVATFGNFINRVFVLTHKYFDGFVPENNNLSDIDLEILKRTYDYPSLICESLDNYKFRQAINQLIDLSRMGNKYLADEEPWKLYKSGELERVQNIMFVSLQICGMLAILSEPFLPNASKKIREIINLKETKWTTLNIDQPILNSSDKINKPELIFRKIEDEEIQNQIDKLNN